MLTIAQLADFAITHSLQLHMPQRLRRPAQRYRDALTDAALATLYTEQDDSPSCLHTGHLLTWEPAWLRVCVAVSHRVPSSAQQLETRQILRTCMCPKSSACLPTASRSNRRRPSTATTADVPGHCVPAKFALTVVLDHLHWRTHHHYLE
jgi:hypothetical protein